MNTAINRSTWEDIQHISPNNNMDPRTYTIPQNMTVEYLLSDHPSTSSGHRLGSTSLTTDVNGAKVLELRYKACPLRYTSGVLREGEVRATWTNTPANIGSAYKVPLYQYTGQASYMDDPSTSATEGFGLMFYGARFYDSAIGRFSSPDSMIPQEQGAQAWDRYAYTNNNPVRYNDPTGHMMSEGCGDDGKSKCAADPSTNEAEENQAKLVMLEQETYDRNCAAGDRNYCIGYTSPEDVMFTGTIVGAIGGVIAAVGLVFAAPVLVPVGGIVVGVGSLMILIGAARQSIESYQSAPPPAPTPWATATATSTPTMTPPPPLVLVTVGPNATATPTPFQPSPNTPVSIFH
jgi:RHS repeat-associated protein